jgi:hypothetical protein
MTILGASTTRRISGLVAASLLLLIAATPVLGYNEQNVDHIRMRREGNAHCGGTVHVIAILTDEHDKPVPGAQVKFSLVESRRGDSLNPRTTFSGSNGRATTTLNFGPRGGTRVVKASVPGDGSARLTIQVKCRNHDDEDNDDHDRNDSQNGEHRGWRDDDLKS